MLATKPEQVVFLMMTASAHLHEHAG